MMFFSWIVGFVLLIFIFFLTDELSDLLGITTYIDYGETFIISNRYYDEEVDGHSTALGHFFMVLSFSVAIRGGMAVYTKTLNGGVSDLGNMQLLIILIGLLLYGILNQILFFSFDLPSIEKKTLDIIFSIGIIYFGYKKYKQTEQSINSKS